LSLQNKATMKEVSKWSKEYFQAYVLMYAATADFVVKEEERNMILDKVNESDFNALQKAFEKESDYSRLQKIILYKELNAPDKKEMEELLMEVTALFKSDGEFDILEQNLLVALRKLLK